MAEKPLTSGCFDGGDRQVTWTGIQIREGEAFAQFLTKEVAARVQDAAGVSDFEAHLRGIASTGFQTGSLQALLEAAPYEERAWAVGEALAEAHLTREHGVEWPWNTERDKRTPLASLPGADLVGLVADDDGFLLVLGEVKCSSESKNPPQVMTGRSGMTNQLENLANDLGLLSTLLRWLFPRCKGTPHESSFSDAVLRLLDSGNKAIVLFGVLIRDTSPNIQDLEKRGYALARRVHAPTFCRLKAIYLPCAIEDLSVRIKGGDA